MSITTKSINNALITYDDRYNQRWLDAVGENVVKYILNPGSATDDTTGDPTAWTMTVTEVGASDSTVVNNTNDGYSLLLTTDAAEYDGINLQLKGSAFKLSANKPLYFGCKLKISDATQSDLLVGLCEVDTTLLNTGGSHALAVTDDGVYFSKLDGGTTIKFTNELDGAEGTTASSIAMDTSDHIYEIYWDGSTLYAYVDNVLVTTVASGLAAVALTPSINFRTGEAVAKTCNIAWMRVFQCR